MHRTKLVTTGCNHLGIAVSDVFMAHQWFVRDLGLPEAWAPEGGEQVQSAGITAGNNFIELEQWKGDESASLINRIGISLTAISANDSLELLASRGFATGEIREFIPPNYSKIVYRIVDLPELSSARLLVYLSESESLEDHDSAWTQTLLESLSGGPLGVRELHQIHIESADWPSKRKLWEDLLYPLPEIQPGFWAFPDGPDLKLVQGPNDEVRRLAFAVRDLKLATDRLRTSGRKVIEDDGMAGVRHPEGLEVFLTESRRLRTEKESLKAEPRNDR